MSPLEWASTIVVYLIVFFPAGAAVLYTGWVFFVFLRLGPEGITVCRWFGMQRTTYASGDVTIWRFVNWRTGDVPEAKLASRVRIEFLDGAWVRLSRYSWNFRRVEAWLRQHAPGAARPVWKLPNNGPSSVPFVVRDVGACFMGLTIWVLCWVGTACCVLLILARRPQDIAGDGYVMRYAQLTVMFFVSLTLGPIGARLMLKDVRINAAAIHIERWFGLTCQTYRESDITWWRVSLDPNPPWWREARESSLVFHLADGTRIVVMGNAANFHRLHEFLSTRASAREHVRPRAAKLLSA